MDEEMLAQLLAGGGGPPGGGAPAPDMGGAPAGCPVCGDEGGPDGPCPVCGAEGLPAPEGDMMGMDSPDDLAAMAMMGGGGPEQMGMAPQFPSMDPMMVAQVLGEVAGMDEQQFLQMQQQELMQFKMAQAESMHTAVDAVVGVAQQDPAGMVLGGGVPEQPAEGF